MLMSVIRSNSTILFIALCFLFSIIGCTSAYKPEQATEVFFELSHPKESFMAGETIELHFKTMISMDTNLQIDNGYGTLILSPEKTDAGISFALPASISTISGLCNWQLFYKEESRLQGQFYVHPRTDSNLILESYLGPRNISAGTEQGAMLVNFPSDIYDNPLGEGTVVEVIEQYLEESQNYKDTIHNLLSWRYLNKKEKTGRIFVRSSIRDYPSGEMYADIKPGAAKDFSITFNRNHEFADGNQQLILSTDQIKDSFNNVVADGTLVTFLIKNGNSNSLYTTATTVNGIAAARIIHPTSATSWDITAYITGEASSNTLDVTFKASIKDFEASFSTDGHQLMIGPFIGFMGQLVPDFTPVSITINYENGEKEQTVVWTENGLAHLDLDRLTGQSNLFRIESLGLVKTISR